MIGRFGKVNKMEVKLVDSTTDPLFIISYAARKCYNSWDKEVLSKRAEFVKGLIKAGHETPLEFANATFEINGISISCQNQMVRHRHASFCVQSGRYVDQRKNDCVLPYELLAQYEGAEDYVKEAKALYTKLVNNGVKREDARFLLPQGMMTNLCVNFNFRALRHFLKLRLDKHAQWEIRQVAREIYFICAERWPWLIEDINV
jgi:thymidylate synthase (FAD)